MKHIIIRGTGNAGKTTTCGALYEELKKNAQFSKLYTNKWEPIDRLQYIEEEEGERLYDFIAVIIIDGVLIIIISQGDVAGDLEKVLDRLKDLDFLKGITGGRTDVDYIVCCARSQNREGSTLEMLYNRVSEIHRKEFWAPEKAQDKGKMFESKKEIVSEIATYIKTKQ
ncbi:MAG: hypothetical protein DI539_18675 [Flavobacterium psychrophilum]|nr:MAG: hypothetical protein DI539_18675 [Flavobacterium psychrophilum]